MSQIEVFRDRPEQGKYYEYAECTLKVGVYPNQRYFTDVPPKYVGKLIRNESGGFGDGSWATDYFENEKGEIVVVNYSYEGRTCFREVERRTS